jgi:hypothetical protein
VSIVEQELLTLPEHLSSPPVLSGTLYHVNPDRNHKLWNIVSTEIYTPYADVLLECCYI